MSLLTVNNIQSPQLHTNEPVDSRSCLTSNSTSVNCHALLESQLPIKCYSEDLFCFWVSRYSVVPRRAKGGTLVLECFVIVKQHHACKDYSLLKWSV